MTSLLWLWFRFACLLGLVGCFPLFLSSVQASPSIPRFELRGTVTRIEVPLSRNANFVTYTLRSPRRFVLEQPLPPNFSAPLSQPNKQSNSLLRWEVRYIIERRERLRRDVFYLSTNTRLRLRRQSARLVLQMTDPTRQLPRPPALSSVALRRQEGREWSALRQGWEFQTVARLKGVFVLPERRPAPMSFAALASPGELDDGTVSSISSSPARRIELAAAKLEEQRKRWQQTQESVVTQLLEQRRLQALAKKQAQVRQQSRQLKAWMAAEASLWQSARNDARFTLQIARSSGVPVELPLTTKLAEVQLASPWDWRTSLTAPSPSTALQWQTQPQGWQQSQLQSLQQQQSQQKQQRHSRVRVADVELWRLGQNHWQTSKQDITLPSVSNELSPASPTLQREDVKPEAFRSFSSWSVQEGMLERDRALLEQQKQRQVQQRLIAKQQAQEAKRRALQAKKAAEKARKLREAAFREAQNNRYAQLALLQWTNLQRTLEIPEKTSLSAMSSRLDSPQVNHSQQRSEDGDWWSLLTTRLKAEEQQQRLQQQQALRQLEGWRRKQAEIAQRLRQKQALQRRAKQARSAREQRQLRAKQDAQKRQELAQKQREAKQQRQTQAKEKARQRQLKDRLQKDAKAQKQRTLLARQQQDARQRRLVRERRQKLAKQQARAQVQREAKEQKRLAALVRQKGMQRLGDVQIQEVKRWSVLTALAREWRSMQVSPLEGGRVPAFWFREKNLVRRTGRAAYGLRVRDYRGVRRSFQRDWSRGRLWQRRHFWLLRRSKGKVQALTSQKRFFQRQWALRKEKALTRLRRLERRWSKRPPTLLDAFQQLVPLKSRKKQRSRLAKTPWIRGLRYYLRSLSFQKVAGRDRVSLGIRSEWMPLGQVMLLRPGVLEVEFQSMGIGRGASFPALAPSEESLIERVYIEPRTRARRVSVYVFFRANSPYKVTRLRGTLQISWTASP